jgi:hypothetical protein
LPQSKTKAFLKNLKIKLPMNDTNSESHDKLSSGELGKKISDFCQKKIIDLYVEYRAQGNSPEEIEKLLKKGDFKDSEFEFLMKEFKEIERLGQGLIVIRENRLTGEKTYNEYISYIQEDLRQLNQMLLSIDKKNPKSIYSNLTEKESIQLSIEIMKTKDVKIKTLFKYKHEKQEMQNVR